MHEERKTITFAQAEGVQPLPKQLALRTISNELSATVWAIVHISLEKSTDYPSMGGYAYFSDPWKTILNRWWITVLHQNLDEMPHAESMHALVKSELTSRNYVKVLGFIEYVVRQRECPRDFETAISRVLEQCMAPYRIVDKTVMPFSSDQEAAAVLDAIAATKLANAGGPRTHLNKSGQELTNGNWAASVRESIHAVESTAKILDPSASTLGPALSKLKDSIGLNPAMERAFKALYGYSSDENGIRHALVFNAQANVTERDAMFMLGACAAFVTYLINTPK